MSDQRPRYHFQPGANWMNDPNGLIQWDGQYHVFYQYNPHGPEHGTIHWGHAVSADLVSWTHMPIALAPTPGGPDAGGCWSGCAVDHDGLPTLMYTGIVSSADGSSFTETQCIATSTDGLHTWTKFDGNPVIGAPPPEVDAIGFRDPFVWREGDGWACVIGSGKKGQGGIILLYRSRDLVQWDYVGPLYTGDARTTEPVWTGSMWECPQFFPLGDSHVLIFSVWDSGKTHHTAYAVGNYAGDSFTPRAIGRFDLGPDYYAPAVMRDTGGRRLVWGWVREARRRAAWRAAGWAGVLSVPRVLTLGAGDMVCVEPVPELRALRGAHYHRDGTDLDSSLDYVLPDVQGECLEIVAEFAPASSAATDYGLLVRCSPELDEYTAILYDRIGRTLVVDREHASLAPESYRGVHRGAVRGADGESVTLRILLDHSVVEVYVNNSSCLTERIYPTRDDSRGIRLVAKNGRARLQSLDVWEMAGGANQ